MGKSLPGTATMESHLILLLLAVAANAQIDPKRVEAMLMTRWAACEHVIMPKEEQRECDKYYMECLVETGANEDLSKMIAMQGDGTRALQTGLQHRAPQRV